MANKIKVQPNQSMLDLILQAAGTLEAGMQFCKDNDTSITDFPVVNTEYAISDSVLALSDNTALQKIAQKQIIFGTLNYSPPTYVTLWTSPILSGTSASYAITPFKLTSGAAFITGGAHCFYNTADEIAFVSQMNLAYSAIITGSFAISGSKIVYNLGPGENWNLSTASHVLFKMLTVGVHNLILDPSPHDYQYVYTGIGSYHVADWGDGTAPDFYNPTSITIQTAAHTYSDALSSKDLNIFHNNSGLDVLSFDYSSTYYTAEAVSGIIPASIIGLRFANQKLVPVSSIPISGVNLSNFLEIVNSPITSFVPHLLSAPFNALSSIILIGNRLSSSEVDNIFNDFVANSPGSLTHTGVINLSGQTPLAPPTTASLSARNLLAAAGWTVITD